MRRWVMAGAVAALVVGCGAKPELVAVQPQPVLNAARKTVLEELPSPAGAGAAEPFLSPARDGVFLSWLEPVTGTDRVALRFARLHQGTWSDARTIVERNDLFVNWADFPSIIEDANGALYAQWLQKSGRDTYAYDVRMSTSTDGGATWREPFLLNRDGKKGEHGFVTLAPLPRGGVAASWLDSRNMQPGHGHGHGGGGMSLRYAVVSAAGAIETDEPLDLRTCECCTTGMAMTSEGPVVVYRDRTADDIRDISFVRQRDHRWTEPATVNADGWKIAGCPVNGPQIDATGDAVATAWFTAAGGHSRALVAFADPAGTFAKPVTIDDGKPLGRVDVTLLDADTALVTWLEQTTTTAAEVRARRVHRDGTADPSIKIADSSSARAAGFPRITRVGADVYFTWTGQNAKTKRVHLARGRFS